MKFLDLLRFIKSIKERGKRRVCATICDCDTEDHKQDVKNHTNMLGTLDVIYHLILMCRLTTCAPLINANFRYVHYYSL